jgi:hypothetical protein
MRASVPVVARAAGAVEGTLGGAGLLLERTDPAYVAAAVGRVLSDAELRAMLVAAGHARVEALSLASAGALAVDAIATVAGSPPGLAAVAAGPVH